MRKEVKVNKIFWENLTRRFTAVAIQLNHVEKEGISNTAKSAYYRAAIILICTIVEALVYQLVKKHAQKNLLVIDKSKEYVEVQELKIVPDQNFVICEKKKKDVHIDDSGVTFAKLNLYLKNKQIIDNDEYEALNAVRVERNKLHLQGVGSRDTGYTKNKFNSITEALPFLIGKLK